MQMAILGADRNVDYVDIDEWITAVVEREERWKATGVDPWRVAYTEIDGPDGRIVVSTVFLGVVNLGGGPFECAVFGGGDVDIVWRGATWDDAAAMHEAVVNERS